MANQSAVAAVRTRAGDRAGRYCHGFVNWRACQRTRPQSNTILKDNISWHYPFPGANTTPWQLEGAIQASEEAAGLRTWSACRIKQSSPTPSKARISITTCRYFPNTTSRSFTTSATAI